MQTHGPQAHPWPKLTLRRPIKLPQLEPVRFYGYIANPSGPSGYTFVLRSTIEQISGAAKDLPAYDLFIHVRDNPALTDPIAGRTWIEFSVEENRRRLDHLNVVKAKIIEAPPAP
jgi:hypothetical protein